MSGELTDKVIRLEEKLAGEYGRPVWGGPGDILDELILTTLSQNTSDVNSGRAFEQFKRRFPDWNDAADASVEEVMDAIKPAGLSQSKAPRIQAILCDVRERFGRMSLDALEAWDNEAIRAYLGAYPGIGPKTAACVLLFSMGRPAMPVDTHVHRTASRLGLIPTKSSFEEAHRIMDAIAPADLIYPLHVELIRHGRARCRPTAPRCVDCPVQDDCLYFTEHGLPDSPRDARPLGQDRPLKATRPRFQKVVE